MPDTEIPYVKRFMLNVAAGWQRQAGSPNEDYIFRSGIGIPPLVIFSLL